ncbi:MAG TPA: GEVED domain-containing protein [Sedimentisphaerales bacterium]|nr:GEVED domain-containing protein [Sedimentisphaerales bacterium]
MKVAGLMRRVVVSCVVFAAAAQCAAAQSGASPGRFAGNFAEVEIVLNDDVGLSDVSALPRPPGADLEIIDGERARVQLSTEAVQSLVDAGAQVTVLSQFALVEGGVTQGSTAEGDASTLGTCSGTYIYDDSSWNVYIESAGMYYGSGIDFSGVPGGHTVSCIDVYYEVRNLDWMLSIVDVAMSDADYPPVYTLESGWYGMDGDIVQTRTGITHFNGEVLSQLWILWAIDYITTGAYIDYWWIKLYYEEGPPPPEYCDARGDCTYEYIEDVVVGTINNTDNGCMRYSDYTSMSTSMEVGTGYPITVVNGLPDPDNQCGIWVDWNADMDFEDAEETISVSGTPGGGPYTATITPPADANLGDTRMRIRIMYTGDVLPCGNDYGEVEDYTVIVTKTGLVGDLTPPEGVDFRDFAVLAGQWKQTPGVPSADIAPPGGDGMVDWLDLGAQVDNWLVGIP